MSGAMNVFYNEWLLIYSHGFRVMYLNGFKFNKPIIFYNVFSSLCKIKHFSWFKMYYCYIKKYLLEVKVYLTSCLIKSSREWNSIEIEWKSCWTETFWKSWERNQTGTLKYIFLETETETETYILMWRFLRFFFVFLVSKSNRYFIYRNSYGVLDNQFSYTTVEVH